MVTRGGGVLTIGQMVEVPELPGRWQVWSKSDAAPGAYFIVREGQVRTIRATKPRNAVFPKIVLLS